MAETGFARPVLAHRNVWLGGENMKGQRMGNLSSSLDGYLVPVTGNCGWTAVIKLNSCQWNSETLVDLILCYTYNSLLTVIHIS